ncbi:hypothetical protein IUJ58_23345 [Priestia aryabhattai]|uniref:hypothetical protein n=1 Tax=Priestia aryabhattai TaxID=412384 RepID=UPI001C0D7BA2|nr:hypothetical protein [Priestia aryabhattai]MBU3573882.1 hypothetical protein [Priestia aryabhattai]WDL86849.1 hypothetical protein IUJ58_23345 [Priestia aryabhattai]
MITVSLCMIVANEEVKPKHLLFKFLLFQRGFRICTLPFASIELVNKKQNMK